MPNQKPIERTFPISEVNRIAEREARAKRHYPRLHHAQVVGTAVGRCVVVPAPFFCRTKLTTNPT